jgi:transposase
LGKIKEKIAGESNEAYLARMEHQRDVERRRTELINQKREQRESQKRGADRLLAAARSHEKSLNNQLTKLIADVGKNKDMLASATANLTRAAAQFQRLSEEGLELVGPSTSSSAGVTYYYHHGLMNYPHLYREISWKF